MDIGSNSSFGLGRFQMWVSWILIARLWLAVALGWVAVKLKLDELRLVLRDAGRVCLGSLELSAATCKIFYGLIMCSLFMFAPNWPRKTLDAEIRLNCRAIPSWFLFLLGAIVMKRIYLTVCNCKALQSTYHCSILYILLYCCPFLFWLWSFLQYFQAFWSKVFFNAFNLVIWILFV